MVVLGGMRVEMGPDRVTKVAESPDEQVALRREARALRICAHPGVVPLLAVEGGEPPQALVLRRAAGGGLGQSGSRSVRSVIGWGAAVAATLGDLHDIGWVHGAVVAEHVLFDGEGRPVLCGFRRAEAPADRSELARGAAGDVAALATLLLDRLPDGSDRRLVHFLSVAAAQSAPRSGLARLVPMAGRPRSGGWVSARQMARRLVELVPDARLGDEGGSQPDETEVPSTAPASPRRRRLAGVSAAVGLCAGVAAVGLALTASARRGIAPPAAQLAVGGSDDYVLSGPPGADLVTLIGRWDCGPARPAVVDLSTGWIWVFDRWPPPGSADTGRAIVHVPQPTGLTVRRSGTDCEQLVALEGSGRQAVIPVSPRR